MPTFVFFIVSLTVLISFFYYKKFKKSIFIYFFIHLYWLFIVELQYNINRVYYLQVEEIRLFNFDIIYNINIIVSFIFYFIVYRELSNKPANKVIIKYLIGFFIVFVIFNNTVLGQKIIDGYNTNNFIFGSIILFIILILFLIEIINNEKIIFNIQKYFIFWVSIGLLIFHIGMIPIMISREYLYFNNIYMYILNSLNIVMYVCYVIGMIKSDVKYNY